MTSLRFILRLSVLLAACVAAMAAYLVPFGWTAGVVLLMGMMCKKGYGYTAYGTARWANLRDVGPMLGGNGSGLLIGTLPGRISRMEGLRALFSKRLPARDAVTAFLQSCQGRISRKPQHLVRLTKAVHSAVFAPPGAGKNVSCVFPLLLSSPEAFIVLDPKGENAQKTAAHRAKAFGQKIVMIDPFRVVTQTPASFNILRCIDPANPESFAQIRAIAEALIQKDPNARDQHWTQKAEVFCTGIIAAVVHFYPPEHRNLQVVASIMADKKLLSAAIEKLKASTVYDGLLSRLGNQLSIPADKELDGILSTIDRSLTFLTDPAVVESTTGSGGFNPAELPGSTVYLILPVIYMRSHAALLRLWVTALMRSVVARGVSSPTPVNVLLDEAAALGPLESISDMLNIGRGFGLKLTLIYQSMGQLMTCWPNGQHQTLLSGTSQVFFAVNDQQTSDYVSNRLGEATIMIEEDSDSDSSSTQSGPQGGSNNSSSTSRSRSRKQLGRKLLKPEEVTALDPRTAITFTPGVPPIATTLVAYDSKAFRTPHRMGMFKASVDTACLFLAAVFLTVMATATLYYHR